MRRSVTAPPYFQSHMSDDMPQGSGASTPQDEDAKDSPGLSQRQRQILEFLSEGKVNKEIANELGIGLGTVKQHVVALFKKLNVSNRAMAVSRAMEMRQGSAGDGASLLSSEVLERRPCVVLTVALPASANADAVRRLHEILAGLAFDYDALFLARKGNACDVIFGIQRVTEHDLIKAVHAASAVFTSQQALHSDLADQLHGGLTVGLAVASMGRFGGWSGEAVASAAIATARDLSAKADPGQLVLDKSARDLMAAFGICGDGNMPRALPFAQLDSLRWTGERDRFHFVGREAELAQLDVALGEVAKGGRRLVILEGEIGMGKSRLCREISERCTRAGLSVAIYRGSPVMGGEYLDNTVAGSASSAAEVVEGLRKSPADHAQLVIVDDFHLLTKPAQLQLLAAAETQAAGRMTILSGRHCVEGETAGVDLIRLRRLPATAIGELVHQVLRRRRIKSHAEDTRAIVESVSGVPLFAVEMAKHYGQKHLAMSLLAVITARLDGLHLDWKMLRAITGHPEGVTLAELAASLGESQGTLRGAVERAVACGVLKYEEQERLAFTHPLLCQAIDQLSLE